MNADPVSSAAVPSSLPRRRLGRAGFELSALSLGGTGLGGLYGAVPEEQGVATILRAVDGGIDYVDSSPFYGAAERRLGIALRSLGERSQLIHFCTKVGTHPDRFGDYSADAVRWSVENSLRVLGVPHVALVQVHALENIDMDVVLRPGGAVEELERLRDEGKVGAIGLGVWGARHHLRAIDSGRFDVVLIRDDYSLIRTIDGEVIRRAAEAGVGLLLGRALMVGLLAGGDPLSDPRLSKHPDAAAAHEWWHWARSREVPLRALALQFAMRNPDVSSVVVGASSPQEVDESLAAIEAPIPSEVWKEVEERVERLGSKTSTGVWIP